MENPSFHFSYSKALSIVIYGKLQIVTSHTSKIFSQAEFEDNDTTNGTCIDILIL